MSGTVLTMRVDSRLLAGVDGMGHVGDVVRVRITNGVGAGDIGDEALGLVGVQAAAVKGDAQLGADVGLLLIREGDEEGSPLDRGAVVKVHAEQVVLGRSSQTRVRVGVVAVLEARDGCDRLVVHGHVGDLQVLLPIREGGLGRGARLGRVGAVGEGHHVAVQGGHLAHETGDVLQGPKETEGLVGVLVSVAPWAPVDTLAPVVLKAGSGGEVVFQTSSKDDLPRRESLLARR